MLRPRHPLRAGVWRALAEMTSTSPHSSSIMLARAFASAHSGGVRGVAGGSVGTSSGSHYSRRCYNTKAKLPLQQIPGVGPKTASLLRDHGIVSVEQLNAKLRQEQVSLADADQIVEFLQEQVGVRHRRHASSIAEYVMKQLGADGADGGGAGGEGGPSVTVSIEGNISVGKSTLIRHMQASNSRLSAMTEFVLEPVERWQVCIRSLSAGTNTRHLPPRCAQHGALPRSHPAPVLPVCACCVGAHAER
jgi:hypothetical protein